MRSRVKGFTLVELAIVLVIIGIILGAVLKGQEMIFNSKVKRVQSQIREIAAAFYTYYDKYGYYPGDDPTAGNRWSGVSNGDGNGLITNGTCDSTSEESCLLWRHLRLANILSGDANATTASALTPKHVFGGPIDVYSDTTSGRHLIQLSNIPGDAASAIDRNMDDGKCDSGSIKAIAPACSGNYTSNTFYNMTAEL